VVSGSNLVPRDHFCSLCLGYSHAGSQPPRKASQGHMGYSSQTYLRHTRPREPSASSGSGWGISFQTCTLVQDNHLGLWKVLLSQASTTGALRLDQGYGMPWATPNGRKPDGRSRSWPTQFLRSCLLRSHSEPPLHCLWSPGLWAPQVTV
jgi:hypothetical protein